MLAGALIGADEEVYVEDSTRIVTDGHSHRVSHGDHYGCESSTFLFFKKVSVHFN